MNITKAVLHIINIGWACAFPPRKSTNSVNTRVSIQLVFGQSLIQKTNGILWKDVEWLLCVPHFALDLLLSDGFLQTVCVIIARRNKTRHVSVP